jgi:uncharacterized membrane protein
MALTSAYPLGWAWWSHRRTSLAQAIVWTATAWLCWVISIGTWALLGWQSALIWRFVALALTGCAVVAVLGARRPGVGPWNFVLLGLLAVLLLPLSSLHRTQGQPQPQLQNTLFMAGVVLVGVMNYLPTRLAPAALLLASGCGFEIAFWREHSADVEPISPVGPLLVAVTPWLVYLQLAHWKRPPNEFDRIWLWFRDRFGLVWSQRVREQFNRAASNAGWPVLLRWQGLRRQPGAEMPGPDVQRQIVAALRALLSRFEAPAESGNAASPHEQS